MATAKKTSTKTKSQSSAATKKRADIEDNKFMAAIAYVGAFCFVPLMLRKKSAFAQFHAKQGLALFLVQLVGFFLLWTFFLTWLGFIVLLISLLFAAWGIVESSAGKETKLPGLHMIVGRLNL